MIWRRQISLKNKILAAIMLATVVALSLTATVLVLIEISSFRSKLISDLQSLAKMTASNMSDAIDFMDRQQANEVLYALEARPEVACASVKAIDSDAIFAQYVRGQPMPEEPDTIRQKPELDASHISVEAAANVKGITRAYVIIWAETQALTRTIRRLILTALAILLIASLVAFFLASLIMDRIMRPVDQLVSTAADISTQKNYSLRAPDMKEVEFSTLTHTFNQMLDGIEKRDRQLKSNQTELKSIVNQLHEEKTELNRALERECDLQEQLDRAKRMESLGMLAGGIAHDLNNFLGPLVGFPDLILDRLGPHHPVAGDILRLKESAQKSATIVQDLLTMARRGNYTTETVWPNRFFKGLFLSPDFRKLQRENPGIQIEQHIQKDLWPIVGSVPHLTQVFLNLLYNSVEAIPARRGRISVTAENLHLATVGEGDLPGEPGDYVKIAIEDSGKGIPPEYLEHIFEPFFTRKTMGRSGSGLGLTIVYGIVNDLGGCVDVQSLPEQGTTFTIYLQRDLEPKNPKQVDLRQLRGTEKVLVVDDIPEQRDLAISVLASMGYKSWAVASGPAALRFLSKREIDLVVLDMILEDEMDGLDVFLAIRKRNPTQRCIIASGYTENDRVRQAEESGALGYVAKPYTRESLGSAVRAALDTEIPSTAKA